MVNLIKLEMMVTSIMWGGRGTASSVNLDVGVLEVVVILMGVCGVGGVAGVGSI